MRHLEALRSIILPPVTPLAVKRKPVDFPQRNLTIPIGTALRFQSNEVYPPTIGCGCNKLGRAADKRYSLELMEHLTLS